MGLRSWGAKSVAGTAIGVVVVGRVQNLVKPVTSMPGVAGGADQDLDLPKSPLIDRP
jgi:hypothetical protein